MAIVDHRNVDVVAMRDTDKSAVSQCRPASPWTPLARQAETSSSNLLFVSTIPLIFAEHGHGRLHIYTAPEASFILAQNTPSMKVMHTENSPVASQPGQRPVKKRAPGCTINALPSELLAEVFSCWVWTSTSDPDAITSVLPATLYKWLAVTRVCRHWHSVATQCANLWSTIIIPSDAAFVASALRRSQQAPLYVYYNGMDSVGFKGSRDLQSLKLVLAELHRIRELRLLIRPMQYNGIRAVLQRPAPCLRVYTIGLFFPQFNMPEALLAPSTMPSLRHFRNSAYTVPWTSLSSMSSLCHLDLSFMDEDDVPREVLEPVELSVLLVALSGMPLLQKLRLHKPTLVLDQVALPVIPMQHLELCELISTPTTCSALLSHLHTTPEIELDIRYTKMEHFEASFAMAPLVSTLRCSLAANATDSTPASSEPMAALMVRFTSPDTVLMTGWRTATLPPSDLSWSGHPEHRSFSISLPLQLYRAIDLIKQLPLKTVKLLWLDAFVSPPRSHQPLQPHDFAALIQAMPDVTELRCYSWIATAYADFLREREMVGLGQTAGWTKLKTVLFTGNNQPQGLAGPLMRDVANVMQ